MSHGGIWGGGEVGRRGGERVRKQFISGMCVNVCVYGGEETKANYIVEHGAPHEQKCAFGDD